MMGLQANLNLVIVSFYKRCPPGTSFLFNKEEVDKWVYLEIK